MTPRSARLGALALALAACPRAPPPLPPVPARVELPAPDVRAQVAEAAALQKAQDEAVWKAWTEGEPLNLASSYAGHEKLFSAETFAAVDRARAAAADPREARALTHFKAYLAGEYLARGLASQADAQANLEASLTFNYAEKELAYRDLDRLLANEPIPLKRRELYAAATDAVQRLNFSVERKNDRLVALVAELGYPSYEAFGAELREADIDALGFLADEVLDRTQALYLDTMERFAERELAMPFAGLTRADLPRLLRPHGVDAYFAKEALVPRARETLAGLGIDLTALKAVTLDLTDGKKKNPRPLSIAVEIPTDLRLSLRPVAGAATLASFFHELGHCLHYAYSTEPRFELAKLGDLAVSEAYSFVFEDLLSDPVWLEEEAKLSGEPLARYLFAADASRLFHLRRAAGNLVYGVALHRPEAGDPKELHRQLLSPALGVAFGPNDASRAAVDAEDLYASADDFRAWLLAAQLQAQLKTRFGAAWWKAPAAGAYLRGLWAHANARTADEIAHEAGEPGLRPDALLARLETSLHAGADGGRGVGDWLPRPWKQPQQLADAGPEADGGAGPDNHGAAH